MKNYIKNKFNMKKKEENTESADKNINEVINEETAQKETEESAEKKEAEPEEDELTKTKRLLAESNDKFLRLFAEFDNYRKRTNKEKLDMRLLFTAETIVKLLPVYDDFERAVKFINESEKIDEIKEGISLVFNKFKGCLNQQGIEEIKSIGEVFNTDLHEAIVNTEAQSEEDKGKIIDETLKGYTLNGKVIRHSKVVVAN